MNASSPQKYALNLGWFLLLLGGISLLDRGIWSYIGILMVLSGLFNMLNTFRLVYLGKSPFLFNPGTMYILNMSGVILLSLGHVFTSKKEISWELLGFMALSLIFMFIAKSGSNSLQPNGSKKTSNGR